MAKHCAPANFWLANEVCEIDPWWKNCQNKKLDVPKFRAYFFIKFEATVVVVVVITTFDMDEPTQLIFFF